jgi:phosphoribosylformimino-5-aminoimidazole carboxamide ribotide isomerase
LDTRKAQVAVAGWATLTDRTVLEMLDDARDVPLAAVIYTDIERDGMMAGPNVAATTLVVSASPFPVIASGGVTTAQDVARIKETGAHGAIIGRALYDGEITLADALDAAGEQAG